MKFKKLSLTLAVFSALILVYTFLVTPRRFFQCLSSPVRYLIRNYENTQTAELLPPVSGNQVQLLVNGNEAYAAILNLIENAEKSIRWQVMLFYPDETGQKLAAALADAARREVQVQLSFNIDQTVNGTLADGYSRERKQRQNQQMQSMLAMLQEAGVEVRDNPPGVDFDLSGKSAQAQTIQAGIQDSVCISANHYDHRKILVVDDRAAIIGGMNVGKQYIYQTPPDLSKDMVVEARELARQGAPEPWEKWLDTAVMIEGPLATELVREFNWKWEILGGKPVAPQHIEPLPRGIPLQLLRQRPGTPEIGARFFDLVNTAQHEILVASPFVSYEPALEALMAASRRGVRVVFVVPNRHQEMEISGKMFRDSASALINAGVQVYYNDLRMAHTKLLVVDGRDTLVGSFNLNHRSFRHDLEVSVVVQDQGFAQQVIERVFTPYLQISYPVQQPPMPSWNPIHWIIRPFT